MELNFNFAKPTKDGWYLVQNSDDCIEPFSVMLYENGDFYVIRGDFLERITIPVIAWALLEYPNSHKWLKLKDFINMGMFDEED